MATEKKRGRLRWKKGDRPKGLARMTTPLVHHFTDGITKYATVQAQYRPAHGWFWYGMGENTHNRPVASAEEAKQQAEQHVRAQLSAPKGEAGEMEAAKGEATPLPTRPQQEKK